jgi:glycosyltransferase involved in cell wall biosynthesis
MQRICTSLAKEGYEAVLIGRKLTRSIRLSKQPFIQKRLYCFFTKGIFFYTEYNIRLFFYLLFAKADAYCAIDLDTIIPCYFASLLRNKPRVYDAHELFTEQKEIVTRKNIHKFWLMIERFAVPQFKTGYTVNLFIKQEFERRYKVNFEIIRNLPILKPLDSVEKYATPTIIYQGAVNEGRSFETLIPAMKTVNAQLLICGVGNFLDEVKALVKENSMEDKVIFKGAVDPKELRLITQQCHIGVMLFEDTGLNQYYSLANRFFDYMMAGIPQLCVNYPEYAAILQQYPFAYLIDDTSIETIAEALNKLLSNDVIYQSLQENTIAARNALNWKKEEKKLITFWKQVL